MLALPLLGFLVAPLLALVWRLDWSHLWVYLLHPAVVQALQVSLATTAIATLLSVLLGLPVAFALARRTLPARRLIDTLIDLPMVLPPAVAGIALLMAFGRRGFFGPLLATWGIEIAFTQIAVVVAQIFVAAPYFVKSASAGFAGVDRELEYAAALDGASNTQVLRYITIPLAWPSLFSGAIMTWARALGEFGATIIFAGNFPARTQTMPLAIYVGFERDIDIAITLACILLGISFSVLFIVKRFSPRTEH